MSDSSEHELVREKPMPWTPSTLCTRCRNLFRRRRLELSPYKGNSHKPYHTKRTWKKSIGERCIMCHPILSQFLDGSYMGFMDCGEDEGMVEVSIRDSTKWHELHPRCLDISFVRSAIFRLEASTYGQRPGLVLARHYRLVPQALIVGSQSDGTLTRRALLQRWFDVCAEHTECSVEASTFRPARLVEIGPTWQRVVETPPDDTAYICLSHRWTNNEVTLLTENLETMKSGFPITQLSDDVAAGIQWTRVLGFQYIWIDTLCIIQDSQSDWLREAQRMADIYKHGFCTLASSDGTEDSEQAGMSILPDERPVGVVHDVRSSWSYNGTHDWCLIDAGYWRLDWREKELNTRGWVFQEALLSRRVVHFHGEQLLWQCGELTASESFPRGFPPEELVGEVQASFTVTGDMFQQRRQAVTRYSTRRLTFGKDKLIAFAGIVARLQSDDWHYAGLWGHDVVRQLLWCVAFHTQMNGKSTRYCPDANAPSWSWANVDAMIDYEEHYYSNHNRVFTQHVEIVSIDPDTLELRICGLLYPHGPGCPLELLRRHGGFAYKDAVLPDVDEDDEEDEDDKHNEDDEDQDDGDDEADEADANGEADANDEADTDDEADTNDLDGTDNEDVADVEDDEGVEDNEDDEDNEADEADEADETNTDDTDDTGDEDVEDNKVDDHHLPPHKALQDLRYLYMQSGTVNNRTTLRCLALRAVPGRQGFYVRFGHVKVDSTKARAYFEDGKNRCDGAAYMPDERGVLTII